MGMEIRDGDEGGRGRTGEGGRGRGDKGEEGGLTGEEDDGAGFGASDAVDGGGDVEGLVG